MNLVDFLWAIPVFGLLVFIHELGHFSVAKFFGIKVHEFALGFGPAIAGFDIGETRYNLRAIPLGGFVRMAGMEELDSEEPRGFNRKPIYARAAVIFAGPLMNFILAALLYAGLLLFVGRDLMEKPLLGEVLPACTVTVAEQAVDSPCPAHRAGLRSGDLVQSINGAQVKDWWDIYDRVRESGGSPLSFAVLRGSESVTVRVEPIRSGDAWMIGIRPATVKAGVGEALVKGTQQTVLMSAGWVQGVGAMIAGKIRPELSGPVGITKTIAETASLGLDSLVNLTAFLSINLGLFNLLPIPALDGSRLIFMGVEWVRGRRLDPQRENMVHFVGFLILISLMIVITYGELVPR